MISQGEIPELRRRYHYLVAVVLLAFGVLLVRLWVLQVHHGRRYRLKAEDNFVQQRAVPTIRGPIYDRNGKLLAGLRPSFDVYATPRFIKVDGLQRFISVLKLKDEQIERLRRRLGSIGPQARMRRVLVLHDIDRDQLAAIEMHRAELPGFEAVAMTQREYPHGAAAAHVIGYLNEVTAAELESARGAGYQPGDLIGRYGVERLYEAHLRGTPGREQVMVDAHGRRRKEKGPPGGESVSSSIAPRPGSQIQLTIDLALQTVVERALARKRSGAAVIVEVHTGRVLASASHPAFDPNRMAGRLSAREARELIEDERRPLLDKVHREHYFPGSTFKPITAIAGLELGSARWDEKISCKGWHHFGRRSFRCSHVHGKVDLRDAIAQSCNVYFYTLAERIGMDALARYAHEFGLGAATGIGLNAEVRGFIPTKAWYAARGQPFRVGFTLNTAIGQGSVKVTPLQIALLYAAIANGGQLYAPQIVERVRTDQGASLEQFRPRVRRQIELKPGTLARMRDALRSVVEDSRGTARVARREGVSVAGKTGTAQVVGRAHNQGQWRDQDHSWFAAYAPAHAPEIALAVLIEHGGNASDVAAPVAMQIIEGYFKQRDAANKGPRQDRTAELGRLAGEQVQP